MIPQSPFNFTGQQSMAVPQIGTFANPNGASALGSGGGGFGTISSLLGRPSGLGNTSLLGGFGQNASLAGSSGGLGVGSMGLSGLGGLSAGAGLTANVAGPSVFGGAAGLGALPGAANAALPGGANAALPSLPPNAQQDSTQMLLQVVMAMLSLVTAMLNPGGAQAQTSLDRSAAPPPVGGAAGNAGNAAQAAVGARTTNVNNDQALQNSLDQIAQDPEGAALLAEAQRRGVTIEVGDPSAAAGAADKAACNCPEHQAALDQGTVVNGVTISQGNQSRIIVRDPSNIKTIVHELGHAVSPEDGNSKDEEGAVEVLGRRVEARIKGTPLEPLGKIFQEKKALYGELRESNGIAGSLAKLGLSIFG